MVIHPIDSLDDPRIAPYRNLKDGELARRSERFIAEGELVVRRLLASGWAAESVLVSDRRVDEIAPLALAETAVYVVAEKTLSQIIGFKFHLGVVACGRRRPLPSLEHVAAGWAGPATVVVLPEITSTENLGALLRISGAFGADAVVLGPRCCDPFYRQAIRVSMGAVFRLAIVRSEDLAADLGQLRQRWGFELAAAVLDKDAEPLATAARPSRLALLFGNEAQGLSPQQVALCSRRITIPMRLGTDSLNVAVAAGVFLFHFTNFATKGVS